MPFKNFTRYVLLTIIFILVLTACGPFQATPATEPQLPQGAVETSVAATLAVMESQVESMVAATLDALPTDVPLATATDSLPPTNEPTATVVQITESPTFTPIPPTPTLSAFVGKPTAVREYACSVFSQKPKDYVVVGARQDFDVRWTLLNTGTKAWTVHGTDYKYVRGPRLHKYADIYDIAKDIGPGGRIEIVVDMIAPKEKGTHVTYWGLANGSNHFCQFYIIVVVQ
jgi:hypothetical protein